jgi:hypothetical protein
MPVGGNIFVIGFDPAAQDRKTSTGAPVVIPAPDTAISCSVSVASRARVYFLRNDEHDRDRDHGELLSESGFTVSDYPVYFPFARTILFVPEEGETSATLCVLWLRLHSNLEVRRLSEGSKY